MVMPLQRPAACSLILVTDVVAERQGGANAAYFNGLAAEWRRRVASYLAHGGSPEHVPTWPQIQPHKGRFQRLYTHPKDGSAQGVILKQLRDHGLDLCPACGEPGTPNTLDHYLPKGKYPEFSITPVNLFPMCDACQGAKLEKTGDATTPRYFIHPYFDTFSREQIIALTIQPPFDRPTFELSPHEDLQADEILLVRTHLRELEIAERYINFFKAEHRRLFRNVARMRNSGQAVEATLRSFEYNAADPTPNAWQHVFYNGVTANVEFLDYLTAGDLPAYL